MFVDKMYLSTEIFDDIEKDNSVPDFCNAIKSEVPGKFSCLIDSVLFTSGLNHITSTVDSIEANFLNFTNLIKNHKENIATEEKYLEQSFGNMPTVTVEKLSDGLNAGSTLVSSATIASGISGISFNGTKSSERIINDFESNDEKQERKTPFTGTKSSERIINDFESNDEKQERKTSFTGTKSSERIINDFESNDKKQERKTPITGTKSSERIINDFESNDEKQERKTPFAGTKSSERIVNDFANKSEETTELPDESENNMNNQESEIDTTTNKNAEPSVDKPEQKNNSKNNNVSFNNTPKNNISSSNTNIDNKETPNTTEEPKNDIEDNNINNSTKEDNQENINMPEYPKNNDEIIEEVIETPTIKNDIKQEDSSNINIGTILGLGAAAATVGVINSKIKEKKDENRSKS